MRPTSLRVLSAINGTGLALVILFLVANVFGAYLDDLALFQSTFLLSSVVGAGNIAVSIITFAITTAIFWIPLLLVTNISALVIEHKHVRAGSIPASSIWRTPTPYIVIAVLLNFFTIFLY